MIAMKTNEKKKTSKKEADIREELKPAKKVINSGTGRMHIQYPAKVGYHGTDEERDLNPEE